MKIMIVVGLCVLLIGGFMYSKRTAGIRESIQRHLQPQSQQRFSPYEPAPVSGFVPTLTSPKSNVDPRLLNTRTAIDRDLAAISKSGDMDSIGVRARQHQRKAVNGLIGAVERGELTNAQALKLLPDVQRQAEMEVRSGKIK
jgi:hypothetical protein